MYTLVLLKYMLTVNQEACIIHAYADKTALFFKK